VFMAECVRSRPTRLHHIATQRLVGTPVLLLALGPAILYFSALATLEQGYPAHPAVIADCQLVRAHARPSTSSGDCAREFQTHNTAYIGVDVEHSCFFLKFCTFVIAGTIFFSKKSVPEITFCECLDFDSFLVDFFLQALGIGAAHSKHVYTWET